VNGSCKVSAFSVQHPAFLRITAEKVWTLCASPDELRTRWADAGQRADIIQQLAERGIDFTSVAVQAGQPDANPFDLLCHLAFNAPVLTAASAPTA
jgi:type I restriction enzyme, R subunit